MSQPFKISLINLPLVIQERDPHTGIVYMPVMLATLSAYLKQQSFDVQVIDAFGEAPMRITTDSGVTVEGLSMEDTVARIRPDTQVVFLYFGNVMNHLGIRRAAALLRQKMPHVKLILGENAQAVSAFSLKHDYENLLNLGFDLLLYGDVESSTVTALRCIQEKRPFPEVDGFIFKRSDGSIFVGQHIPLLGSLDDLPFPDWKSFPLQRYWALGYTHGPFNGPYLPTLTSRGCPVRCRFCIIPSTNNQKWRSRSPANVVAEMAFLQKEFGVNDFHLEDVNPTVNDTRTREICDEILKQGLQVTWKIVSGVKIENIKPETIPLMAKAGCRFIGFSPETGSPELLKKMNKPFNHKLALELVRLMRQHGIRSQACFILGYPGETPTDVQMTKDYIRQLVLAGVDEIAQFIVTPIPGSEIADQITGFTDYSQLTFSPNWRSDYKELSRRRSGQYLYFALLKVIHDPFRVLRSAYNVLRGRFEIKSEQAIFRMTLWRWMHSSRS